MRRRLPYGPWDYVRDFRPHRWDAAWIERPRLWSSAVALALFEPRTVVDPACGDATVVMMANALSPIRHAILGDISPDTLALIPELPFPNERRVADAWDTLRSLDRVDAIVLTEFIEHIEDPDGFLRLAREKSSWLVASSPIVPDGNDHTTQHMWAFDTEGYEQMLREAGWTPAVWQTVGCETHPYTDGFQVWGAK